MCHLVECHRNQLFLLGRLFFRLADGGYRRRFFLLGLITAARKQNTENCRNNQIYRFLFHNFLPVTSEIVSNYFYNYAA